MALAIGKNCATLLDILNSHQVKDSFLLLGKLKVCDRPG